MSKECYSLVKNCHGHSVNCPRPNLIPKMIAPSNTIHYKNSTYIIQVGSWWFISNNQDWFYRSNRYIHIIKGDIKTKYSKTRNSFVDGFKKFVSNTFNKVSNYGVREIWCCRNQYVLFSLSLIKDSNNAVLIHLFGKRYWIGKRRPTFLDGSNK